MNSIREIARLSRHELEHDVSDAASWHAEYRHSPWVYVGGLHSGLNEGDIRVVFAQFGEVVDVDMARRPDTGQPRGFAFVKFNDQRSTNLAVDNLNGTVLLGRTLRVDHVRDYKSSRGGGGGGDASGATAPQSITT